ncbi:LuxR C-terminal-related transcriptional regulator [Pseudomonas sp. 2FG]|uniref:LuxR C-terminal-related transcriptional regulator n=1 Tax=Pseudomonas sp. 2FG TaxID=2502191 RepID=UPI0010F4ECFC|nr:LuxR C-terminal-related transcriptional regulator [Pseudomonas sp. 2FG]
MPRQYSGIALPSAPLAKVPRLPPAHLPRPRLLELLHAEEERLRLLVAPAGFGKSVLLSEYLRQLPAQGRVIWLGLAGQPLSAEQLFSQIATALDSSLPASASTTALLQLLGGQNQPVWLVLDDYPSNPPAELDACIDQLLARPQSNLYLLVSARQRPEWNLPRLLLAGELLELEAQQLAFSRSEQEELIDLLAPQSGQAMRAELWQETEGWCAGTRLQLSGKTMPQSDPAKACGQNIKHCWLKEYLDHELLNRLDAEETRCLLALVHLPKISAELCQHLWEESDGAQLFQRLLQRQAFFMPLDEDGVWYRVLPVVARVLRNRISATAATQLHLRACRMFIAAGQVEDAIEQALCAGQPEVAANYLERLGQEWLTGEQHLAHLLAWRERLPAVLLESTPRLLTLNAWALLLSWRLDQAEACIDQLARFQPQPSAQRRLRLTANWQALRGALAALRGNHGADDARRHCQQALEHLPEADWMPKLLCYSTLARVAMATRDPQAAPGYLRSALELARRQGSLLFEALINLDRIRLLLMRGELPRAQSLIEQSFALIGSRKALDSLLLGRLHLLQAELHLLHGEHPQAERSLQVGVAQAQECADPFVLHGYLGLAELSSRHGQFDQAFLYLREAERQMQCGQVWRLCYRGVQLLQSMRVFGRQGRWERITPIAEGIQRFFHAEPASMAPLDYPTLALRNRLLLARALHAAGDAEQAEGLLQALLELCNTLQFKPLACEVQLALAQAGRSLGRADAASLEHSARQQAETLGLHGMLQDWPDPKAGPVNPAAPKTAAPGDHSAAEHNALLSQRERAVLQLLADGFSNQEIGTYLFISVNTVKTHAKKINSKLGVKRRTQALMRAKSLGLLA